MKKKIFTGALPDGSMPTYRDETAGETLLREWHDAPKREAPKIPKFSKRTGEPDPYDEIQRENIQSALRNNYD